MTLSPSAEALHSAVSSPPQGCAPVSLHLPKDPAMLAGVRMTVAGVALQSGLSLETIEDLKVIAAEACTYCIQRGGTKDGRVRVALEPYEDRFVIEVSDPSFTAADAVQRQDGRTADNVADELYIIRALAEELEYQLDPQFGLRLRATKSTRCL